MLSVWTSLRICRLVKTERSAMPVTNAFLSAVSEIHTW